MNYSARTMINLSVWLTSKQKTLSPCKGDKNCVPIVAVYNVFHENQSMRANVFFLLAANFPFTRNEIIHHYNCCSFVNFILKAMVVKFPLSTRDAFVSALMNGSALLMKRPFPKLADEIQVFFDR